MSLNGFLQLNSYFAPRLSTSTLHESATALSNHPRAPAARTESLRLRLAQNALPTISLPWASRLQAHNLPLQRRPQPPTATLQIIRTRSTLYKTHRLPRGAASFKSLYLKRPFHER